MNKPCKNCITTRPDLRGILFPTSFSDRKPSADGKVFCTGCTECGPGYADNEAAARISAATGWPVKLSYDRDDDTENAPERHLETPRPYFAVTLAEAARLMLAGPRMFLNVYAVGRVCYGSAEGGDWGDVGRPLASVPIPAETRRGCGPHCGTCGDVERGVAGAAYCRTATEEAGEPDEAFQARYAASPETTHLVPAAGFDVEAEKARLKWMFADEQCPRGRYSVLGGDDVEVYLEDHFARPFPQERHEYE